MKKLSVIFLALVSLLSAFSQGKDVVDIAIRSADLTTLVAAVKAADLVTTLKSAEKNNIIRDKFDWFEKY
jgi:uncharacterized surface protein with fasciclin (FAS1) repeats